MDAYVPAPEALERPEWVVREGKVWAYVGGTCQPVAIDDAARGKLEVTTCVQDDVTCGVTITATGEATLDRAWCRRDRDLVTGFVDDDALRLVEATGEHAAYRQLVTLTVGTVGLRDEWQQCTDGSLRALKRRREHKESSIELVDQGRVWFDGRRVCRFVDGFAVIEHPLRAPPVQEGTLRRESDDPTLGLRNADMSARPPPPIVDCTVPCSPTSWEDALASHQAAVAGRIFLTPEPRGIDLFRTSAACTAASAPPSVLPTDLCATLGARLR